MVLPPSRTLTNHFQVYSILFQGKFRYSVLKFLQLPGTISRYIGISWGKIGYISIPLPSPPPHPAGPDLRKIGQLLVVFVQTSTISFEIGDA